MISNRNSHSLGMCVVIGLFGLISLAAIGASGAGRDNQPADISPQTQPADDNAATRAGAATPTGPTTAPSVRGRAFSTGLIRLKWNPVAGVTYYDIFRSDSTDFVPAFSNLIHESFSDATYADGNVSAGRTYYYQVFAVLGRPPKESSALVGKIAVTTPIQD